MGPTTYESFYPNVKRNCSFYASKDKNSYTLETHSSPTIETMAPLKSKDVTTAGDQVVALAVDYCVSRRLDYLRHCFSG